MNTLRLLLYKKNIFHYNQNSYFSPFCHKQKVGSKIEKLKNIIISLERVVAVEVRKVVERMKVVVVSEPKVVMEVQERQVWRVVEK